MSSRTMARWLAVALLMVWMTPVGAAAQGAGNGQQAEGEGAGNGQQAASEGPMARKVQRAADREARAAKRDERKAKFNDKKAPARVMWWNEVGIVKELALSDDVRKQFDEVFEGSHKMGSARSEVLRSQGDYNAALKKGDWKAAEGHLAEWASQTAMPIEEQGKLKLTILGKLSAEQREKLTTKYASIIPSKWVPRPQWGPRQRGGPSRGSTGTAGKGGKAAKAAAE